MSHLIIEQGEDLGREVAVPPSGMKFGRSPANDLVLEDDAVMLFHGRFFFKSDGTLWVTDFGAGEKTTVGGEPVDEYQLSVGDLVEVGSTAFRIINTKQDADQSVAEIAPVSTPGQPEPDDIDLGFKASRKKIPVATTSESAPKKASLTHRLMQLGVSLLVLVVLVIVGPELMKIASSDKPVVQQEQILAFSYERVRAGTDNIYRYYLELDQAGRCTISIDDLKGNRHFQNEKKLSDAVVLQLSQGIRDSGFFEVDSDYAGTAQEQHDLYDLGVLRNRRYHHIKVLNREPPKEIERAASLLEDFALSELNVPPSFKWKREKLVVYAEQAYELGKARFAERDVRHGNLAESIKHYRETMLYLETLEPKPNLYYQARDGLKESEEMQTVRYEEYMFRADRSIRLREWAEAQRQLQILAELIADREDPRFEKINTKLLNVEQHLR